MATRKNMFLRKPPETVAVEAPLSEAVAHGLAELGTDATPSELERWVKDHHHPVWLRLTPAAMLKAIDIEREKVKATQPRGDNGMARRNGEKRVKAVAQENERAEAAPVVAVKKAVAEPAAEAGPPAARKPARPARVKKAEQAALPEPVAPPSKNSARTARVKSAAPRQRAKRKEADAEAAVDTPPKQKWRPNANPTVEELRRVRSLAGKAGGVAELRKVVEKVARLAEQVGGLDSLAACLDVLEEFGVK